MHFIMIKLFLVLSSFIARSSLVASQSCLGFNEECENDSDCCGHPQNKAVRPNPNKRVLCVMLNAGNPKHCYEDYYPVTRRTNKIHGNSLVDPVVGKALEQVPEWLQEYVKWHAVERKKLTPNSPSKIMVLTCLNNKEQCGGISDRLASVPYFVRIAAKTNRLFFIKWNKLNLEDYLTPPDGGIDWRLPEHINLSDTYEYDDCNWKTLDQDPSNVICEKNLLVMRKPTHTPNYEINPDFKTVAKPEGVYREMWDICFKPAPHLQLLIDHTMKKLGLKPKQFLAAQIRTMPDASYHPNDHSLIKNLKTGRWQKDTTATIREDTKSLISGMIKCVINETGDKNLPVYITSSRSVNIEYALLESPYAETNQKDSSDPIKLVGEFHPRLHTDKQADHATIDPKHMYPAFVDLYMMGNSKCVSYGRLGYGRTGARLAGNKCHVRINHCKKAPE